MLKTRSLLVTSFLLVTVLSMSGQSHRYGKISDDQWGITDCLYDSSAEALILFDLGKFEYEFNRMLTEEEIRSGEQAFTISFTRHLRIKLLSNHNDPETYIKIPLYLYPEKSLSLNTFKAILITKNGQASKQVKYKKKDLIESTDEDGLVNSLVLDNLPEGSILDIEFRMISNYLFHIPDWSFCSKYPTLISKVSYTIPSFIDVSKRIEIKENLAKKTSMRPSNRTGRYEYKAFWFEYEEYELDSIQAHTVPYEPYILKCYLKALNLRKVSRLPEPIKLYYLPSYVRASQSIMVW